MNVVDLPERLRSRIVVDEGSGCWRWTGGRAGKGYPYVWWERRMSYVHRIVYNLFVDPTLPISRGGHAECIDHVAELCAHRPDCVNPAHLERVTWAENVRRHYRRHPDQNRDAWARRRDRSAA